MFGVAGGVFPTGVNDELRCTIKGELEPTESKTQSKALMPSEAQREPSPPGKRMTQAYRQLHVQRKYLNSVSNLVINL